jgi:hypothetical protein
MAVLNTDMILLYGYVYRSLWKIVGRVWHQPEVTPPLRHDRRSKYLLLAYTDIGDVIDRLRMWNIGNCMRRASEGSNFIACWT